jgi:hypothetical protein
VDFRSRPVFAAAMRLLALVPAIVVLVCADASASVSTTRLVDAQGDPQLVVYAGGSGGSGSVEWSTCPPDSAVCIAAGAWQTSTGGSTFTAGPTAAGTVLRADGTWEGQPIAFRATWLGTVTAVAPPVFRGRAIAGTRVQATPGSWSGGWGDERSDVRVQACKTREARTCQTVVAAGEAADGAVTVNARYTGWYLFAVDIRKAREVVPYPMPAVALPLFHWPVAPGQTIAFSAPVGPVVGPTAALRRRALYRDGRPQLGTVRCPAVACTAVVRVRHGATTRTQTLTVTGTETIAPRLRLRPGAWRVSVTIDGVRAAQRRVAVRE